MSTRIFPKHIGTAKRWRARKRREWRAVLKALDTFTFGCAYTPVGEDFNAMKAQAREIQQALRGHWMDR